MERLAITSFLIEHRSRIQSANVFIVFNQNLSENNNETKIQLTPDAIIINTDQNKYQISVKSFFNINIKTLCNLIVKNNSMSFRFNTNENNFGLELLELKNDVSIDKDKNSIKINTNEDLMINCSNCKSNLTEKPVNIQRILELPSGGLDLNDWFCHKPHNLITNKTNNSSCFNEEEDGVTSKFQPKINDIFYSHFYVLMNQSAIDASKLRIKNQVMHCHRCLQYLGELPNSTSMKLWCENIRFNETTPFFEHLGAKSVISLIRDTINNFQIESSYLFLSSIIKVLFETKIPSSENVDAKMYLLIQIMDKNLDLFKLNQTSFMLEKTQSLKLMYHIININNVSDDQKDQETLKFWMNETSYELSFKVFNQFCKYLEGNSKFIPDFYRKNNLFYLSYIDI